MFSPPILKVVQQFLKQLQNYNADEIKSILDFLPTSPEAVNALVLDIESELFEPILNDDLITCTQSQPIKEAGVTRMGKRLVNESDDEEPQPIGQMKKGAQKKPKVDIVDEESEEESLKFKGFLCPRQRNIFEHMNSVDDLNTYKESEEYLQVLGSQTLRRSKQGRKLLSMVEAQQNVFDALEEGIHVVSY